MEWTREQLWQLRQEIAVGDLFIDHYRNSFGVDRHACCDFFEGYLEFMRDENEYDVQEGLCSEKLDVDDDLFWEKYDSPEMLERWYYMFVEEDPLPITEEV